ncbi:uncharacterized protein BX663DRAFT_439736 [Cokeromyces recurvatus]|uniref:uncharacterized protein n=1 Tax=Cokeromyces recurvatus TaxID=90255 RepID=UPI0022200320|nr:uncharacterized protein BX663DRAFT_439736 [Cokeromyces recurvatus]KAI7900346.1 hypothetical protein BX663DRAFT_439736 [Cokeromyces recurvatus]
MFFFVKYTKENVEKYRKRIKDFDGIEICYNLKPTQPILVLIIRIYENPQSYHLYLSNTSNLKA